MSLDYKLTQRHCFKGLNQPSILQKEATVAGIAAFRADHYEVKLIFSAGMCKRETAPSCIELI
jgi:hypothetical protein